MIKNIEDDDEPTERVQLPKGVGRRSGGTVPRAKRLSARGAFVLDVLLKVRRMTDEQLGRLCGIENGVDAVRCARRRLLALGFVASDDFFRDGSRIVLRLTESGHRVAAARTGNAIHTWNYRDDVHPDMMQHLLKATELFVETVGGASADWMDARERADAFFWQSSNDDTSFLWKQPSLQGDPANRRVIPDVTVELGNKRVFIEIERSTKTLGVVFKKIAQYHDLFSPAQVIGAQTAYEQKYPDRKPAEVWWVFDSDERAKHVREHVARQMGQPMFYTPASFVGTLPEAAARLREGARLAAVPILANAGEIELASLRSQTQAFLRATLTELSSLKWPANWRSLGKMVFSAEEWARLEPGLVGREANARAKQQSAH